MIRRRARSDDLEAEPHRARVPVATPGTSRAISSPAARAWNTARRCTTGSRTGRRTFTCRRIRVSLGSVSSVRSRWSLGDQVGGQRAAEESLAIASTLESKRAINLARVGQFNAWLHQIRRSPEEALRLRRAGAGRRVRASDRMGDREPVDSQGPGDGAPRRDGPRRARRPGAREAVPRGTGVPRAPSRWSRTSSVSSAKRTTSQETTPRRSSCSTRPSGSATASANTPRCRVVPGPRPGEALRAQPTIARRA